MGFWPTAILETGKLRQGSGPIWGIVGRGSGRLEDMERSETRRLWGSLGSGARRKGAERGETYAHVRREGQQGEKMAARVQAGMWSCALSPRHSLTPALFLPGCVGSGKAEELEEWAGAWLGGREQGAAVGKETGGRKKRPEVRGQWGTEPARARVGEAGRGRWEPGGDRGRSGRRGHSGVSRWQRRGGGGGLGGRAPKSEAPVPPGSFAPAVPGAEAGWEGAHSAKQCLTAQQ